MSICGNAIFSVLEDGKSVLLCIRFSLSLFRLFGNKFSIDIDGSMFLNKSDFFNHFKVTIHGRIRNLIWLF